MRHLVLAVLVGCGQPGAPAPTPSPSPTETPAPTPSPGPTPAPTPDEARLTPVLTLSTGRVQGEVRGDVHVFLGVQYGDEPIGPRRLARASPGPFPDLLTAVTPARPCPQPARRDGSESCLSVSVWAPADADGVPVVVWFEGGAYAAGGAAEVDAAALAREGVVVVVPQARLGALGHLADPSLRAGDGQLGNWWLTDLVEALRWVEANAAAFGGDPEAVTAVGVSTGAGALCALLAMPVANGLIDRAVLHEPIGCAPQADPDAAAAAVRRAVGCEGAADVAACLRAAPAQAFVDALPAAGPLDTPWGPVVDGRLIDGPPGDRLLTGAPDRPVVVALHADDDPGIVPPVVDLAGLRALIAARTGRPELTGEVMDLYDARDPAGAAVTFAHDHALACPARALWRAQAGGAAPAWALVVEGVGHDEEGALALAGASRDPALGAALRRLWASFARDGAPTAAVAWPPVEVGGVALRLGADAATVDEAALRGGRCDALAALGL